MFASVNFELFLYWLCRNPESIILCVLPDDKCDDITMQIHFTLIEAFCLENNILVLKVHWHEFYSFTSFNLRCKT